MARAIAFVDVVGKAMDDLISTKPDTGSLHESNVEQLVYRMENDLDRTASSYSNHEPETGQGEIDDSDGIPEQGSNSHGVVWPSGCTD
jgi:hypothetical protein